MDKVVAYCGIVCSECPTFLATREDDNTARGKVAAQWSELFKTDIQVGDINCDGCLPDNGRLFSYCAVCGIRKCGREKGVENCAHCVDYPCERLNEWFAQVPEAKATLEQIRSGD